MNMTYRDKLYKNIEASKIDIDYRDLENTYKNIITILINSSISNSINNIIHKDKKYDIITVYHIDSFYRDNSKDKYELLNNN